MRKKKQLHRTTRNITLPSWLKLRMDDNLKTQVDWMIERADRFNAGSMSIVAHRKNRPWDVILTVKREKSYGHQEH